MEATAISAIIQPISDLLTSVTESITAVVLQKRAIREAQRPVGSFWERNRINNSNPLPLYFGLGLIGLIAVVIIAEAVKK